MQTMLVLGIIFTVMMVAGLSKPWLLLWWRATQTRWGVIKLYGGCAAVSYFVYWILKFTS